MYAVADSAYVDDTARGNKVLRFSSAIAPISIGVFSLVNKLNEQSNAVYEALKNTWTTIHDTSGSIGRRYARADEQGIPYCITVDYDSLTHKDVTIRDRETTQQVRIPINELDTTLHKLINKNEPWNDVTKGKKIVEKKKEE